VVVSSVSNLSFYVFDQDFHCFIIKQHISRSYMFRAFFNLLSLFLID